MHSNMMQPFQRIYRTFEPKTILRLIYFSPFLFVGDFFLETIHVSWALKNVQLARIMIELKISDVLMEWALKVSLQEHRFVFFASIEC